MGFSNKYIVIFAVVICLVCSLLVSSLAVALRERQDENKLVDKYENILVVAGLKGPDEKLPADQVKEMFATKFRTIVIDRKTGTPVEDPDPEYDPIKAAKDSATSVATTSTIAKLAQVKRLPNQLVAYEVTEPGKESYVLPIYGNGLWSTLYGYLAIAKDRQTVLGLTYYAHAETPGLGGEVDNRKWKELWPGKKLFAEDGTPKIAVVKGSAKNEFEIDGLSGATITSNGVTNMLHLWLGEEGYKHFLDKIRN